MRVFTVTSTIATLKSFMIVIVTSLLIIACKKESATSPGEVANTPRTSVPAELVGDWHSGTTSFIGFYDRASGRWSNPSENGFSYRFSADGYFEYGGLLKSNVAGCSYDFYSYKIGTVTVEGTTLTIYPLYSRFRKDDSCSPQNNYDKQGSLDPSSVSITIEYHPTGVTRMTQTSPDGTRQYFFKR